MKDISALCAHAHVDESFYQVFPRSTSVRRTAQSAPPEAVDNNVSSQVQSVRQPSRIAIWDDAPVHQEPGLTAGTVAISRMAGGVGATTVISTTARALASMGRAVMILDSSERPACSLHFGGAGTFRGSQTFVVLGEAGRGGVHLLTRELPGRGPDAGNVDAAMRRAFINQQAEVSEVLIDDSASISASNAALMIPANATEVVVIVPDLISVLGVREAMALQGTRPAYFLLNKFDPAISSHLEIRDWLSKQVGQHLLPFSIGRSDLVPEALLSGQTVVDYAPGSAVASDFLRFADWVKCRQRVSAQSRSKTAVA